MNYSMVALIKSIKWEVGKAVDIRALSVIILKFPIMYVIIL